MRNGFKILDIDRHVIEPLSMWSEYLPARLHEWAPVLQAFPPIDETLNERLERLGDDALLPTPPVPAVRGTPIYRGMNEAGYVALGAEALLRRQALAASATGPGQLANLDALGIDLAVLLPTYASYLVHDEDHPPEISRAYADAYNRWLCDVCSADRNRLRAAAMISCHEPEQMVADLEAALRLDPSAVVLRPNPIRRRTLAHPSYARFWQACAAQGLPVLLHEGTHARAATAGADRFTSRFGQHACSHPLEAMMGLLSLIEGGVFEDNPALRVALLEAGCGWLPYWLWRLDHVEYRHLRFEVAARVRKPPSSYFREQCWIAAEPGEPLLRGVVDCVGADRVVLGTDFPHLDHDVEAMDTQLGTSGLDERIASAILWDNPARLLGMRDASVSALRAEA